MGNNAKCKETFKQRINSETNYRKKELFLERLVSLFVGLAGLLISIPIILVVIIVQQLDDCGPVFFTQKRVGKDSQIFLIYKIRTMKVHDPKNFPKNPTCKYDPRISRFGRFIRMTRIDELPQFLNLIKGDMNLIGPRPEQVELVERYSKNIPRYKLRHQIKPGITGWAQVNYSYGSDENDAKKKLDYDLYYINNKSIWLDFRIILNTIHVIIGCKGM